MALAMQPGYTVSLVARQYGIKPSLLFKLKRFMIDGGKSAITAGDEVVSISGVKALEKKVKQPEQMLGLKTMEAEILRDALVIDQVKKLISRMPLLPPDDISSLSSSESAKRCRFRTGGR
ncbi:transposase [Klebsiella aerogenes]|nr:transposase [Klebsiella aerogenes]